MAIRRPNLAKRPPAATPARDPAAVTMDGYITVRAVQLAEIISRGASQVFETRFGVKNTELRILVHLGGQALAVNELARRTHVDKAWISRSLRGLEARGRRRRVGRGRRAPHRRRRPPPSRAEDGRCRCRCRCQGCA